MPYKASSGGAYAVEDKGSGKLMPGWPNGLGCVFVGSRLLEVKEKPIGDVQLVVPRPRALEWRKLSRVSRARPMAAPNWKAWVFLVHDRSSFRLCRFTWKLWL